MSQFTDRSIDERIAQRRARTAELKRKRKRQMLVQLSVAVLAVVLLAMVAVFMIHAFSTGTGGNDTPTLSADDLSSEGMQIIQSDLDGKQESDVPSEETEKQPVIGSGETQTGESTDTPQEDAAPEAEPDSSAAPENNTDTDAPTEPDEPAEDETGAEDIPVTNVGRYAETVIYVDPGRGYSDLGCTSEYLNGLHEQQINLDVALQAAQLLTDYGFTVLMTHDSNEIPAGQPEDYVLDQYARVDMANHSDCVVYLSIHCDYFPTNPDAAGTRLYYCTDVANSAAFAEALSEGFSAEGFAAPQLSGKDKNNSFIVTSQVNVPSVLVELGFVTNASDAKALSDAAYRTRLAEALAAGVIGYLGFEE
ncbi:MAG: hypothetical protein E7449_01890 [Ruminococcaceae bacterium]|nr:hypothetical protein [Oscillospiraceae bacterium]